MGKERTESSKFLSRYTGSEETWITGAQYLVETICERLARKDGLTLPNYFWRKQEWVKEWRVQSNHASKLLKEFEIDVILEALKDWRLKKVYSLGLMSAIRPVCEKVKKLHESKMSVKEEAAVVAAPVDTSQKPRAQIGNRTKLSKLRDLE